MRAAYTLAGGGFNTQPPEGGWVSIFGVQRAVMKEVSTHSRPKAAGMKQAKR